MSSGSIGNESNKTGLDTLQLMKIKSRETPKQEVTDYQPQYLQP